MINSRLLLLLSATAYTLPFVAPFHFWWLTFLFPSFLFLALHQNKLLWTDLLIWSLTVSTVHLFPLGNAIIQMTSAPLYVQLLPTILLIMYVTLYPFGLLIGITTLFHRFKPTLFAKLLIWTVSLWLYLLTVDYALFWIFGRMEGYVFMNPLLPLAAAPSLLILIHWLLMPFMLLLYCITTSMISWFLLRRSIANTMLLFLVIVVWIAPSLLIHSTQPPAWLNQVGHLPMILPETMPAERGSVLIAYEVQQLAMQHPDLRLVIMPESAWNGLPLNEVSELPSLKDLSVSHVIIGSFSLQDQIHYNSLYWFKRGQRAGQFDKCHAVPFIERIPWGGQLLCTKLFFKKSDPICPTKKLRSPLIIDDSITLIPYICSELFMNNNIYDPASTHPILAACNDWWFGLSYFRQLMLMVAQLRAIQWNRPILYISFYYAQYIDPYGIIHPITTTINDRFLK